MDQAAGRQPDLEIYVASLLGPYEQQHPPTSTASYDDRAYSMLRAYNVVRPHVLRQQLEIMNAYNADIDVTIFD